MTSRFDWLQDRAAGVLLHPTSLPGPYGVGTLGAEAFRFADFLQEAGCKYWQVLPLGPTGYGDSPYQSFSAFAGNPYLIDLADLVEKGLLLAADLEPLQTLPRQTVDFGALYVTKWPILRLAWRRFHEQKLAGLPGYGDWRAFIHSQSPWLEDYALFMSLKNAHGGASWQQWPKELRTVHSARVSQTARDLKVEIESHCFFQYLFFGQWERLRLYTENRGIRFIGDLPIFVSLDSADVWSRPELFQLDAGRNPTFVAGVPPDYFSASGQLWGNPLFNWKRLAAEGYDWWLRRLRTAFQLCEVIRLDHFRGFHAYWRIPARAKDARSGKWAPGPRHDFIEAIRKGIPTAKLIAEDLGLIPPEVRAFLAETGLPGMAIMQFAFDGASDNLYLPHNHSRNSVLYPGTHDNQTTVGWYRQCTPDIQDQVRRYLRVSGSEIAWDILRSCYASPSRLTVIPMQDLLCLGAEARMNTPGTPSGNWTWRHSTEQLEDLRSTSARYLHELAWLYGR